MRATSSHSGSASQTAALAEQLAAELSAGDVVLLQGPVGAGKTTFVAAVARALGSGVPVSSPTFGLVHRYAAPQGELVHLDLHRLAPAPASGSASPELPARDLALLDEELDRAAIAFIEHGGL